MTATPHPGFSILLVDDEPAFLHSLSLTLERQGITNLLRCDDSRQVSTLMQHQHIGLVILDLTMPHLSGREVLSWLREEYPEVNVIILSGLNQVETAVDCLRMGAFDYFVKTAEQDRLLEGIKRAIQMQELRQENQALRQVVLHDTLQQPECFESIITTHPSMWAVFQYLESVARSRQPILISGESGVGKELIARAAHAVSQRRGPLVTVNVAGLDDNVFADTLFGHQRGAFTGADKARPGLVEQAAEGTLFLDEIGDLSPASQVKLLRLLQEGEYYPLGSDRAKQCRARVIVATHQDLPARQSEGRFRKDLYYRLRTHQVHIPPLRERREDIPLLLEHFLSLAADDLGRQAPALPQTLATLLQGYSFPGNIRELRAMVYDAISQNRNATLELDTFLHAMGVEPSPLIAPVTPRKTAVYFDPDQPLPSLQGITDLLVEEAMQRANRNQSLAARLIGVSQPALSKRLKKQRDGDVDA